MALSRLLKYRLRDRAEASWRFVWDRVTSTEGWWGWRRQPGQTEWICLGVYSEEEVAQRVLDHQMLTDDDRIDLHLWLTRSGYQELVTDMKEDPKLRLLVQN